MEQILAQANQFADAIRTALVTEIAVTDARGEIIYVNEAWSECARAHGDPPSAQVGVGANYLQVCERSSAVEPQVVPILEGMQAVLRGDRAYFASEYFCQGLQDEAWYFVWITPIQLGTTRGLVITHRRNPFHNFSAQSEMQVEVTRELDGLPDFSKATTTLTAKMFGMAPLRETAPEQFRKLTRQYSRLLEQAVERRIYKIEPPMTGGLRQIANDLGFLKTTPRDVIDIHTWVLRQVVAQVSPSRSQTYVEESRLMLIELMGYMMSYYRNFYSTHSQLESPQATSSLDGGIS